MGVLVRHSMRRLGLICILTRFVVSRSPGDIPGCRCPPTGIVGSVFTVTQIGVLSTCSRGTDENQVELNQDSRTVICENSRFIYLIPQY